jgi:hypothetical protein
MKKTFLILLSMVMYNIGFAQPKTDEFKPEIKVGATVLTGWEFNMDNAEFISKLDTTQPDGNIPFGYKPTIHQFETSKNSFFLERSYINVRAWLTPQITARVTPDIYSFTDATGKTQYAFQVKFAYFTYTPVKTESGLSLGFSIGLIPNIWIPVNERYYGYRGIAKTLTDYNWTTSAVRSGVNVNRTTGSYFATADLGLDAGLVLPKGYAEINLDLVNGNGFRNLTFDNRFKDVFVSAFIHPLAVSISKKVEANKKAGKDRLEGTADVTIGGFGYLGKLDKSENYTPNAVQYKRNRFGGMAFFKYNFKKAGFFKIGGELSVQKNEDPASSKPDSLVETNARGISGYLEFNPPVEQLGEKFSLLARYDVFDPNTDNSDASVTTFNNNTDKQTLILFGLVYKPAKMLTLSINYQSLMYDQNYIVKYDGTTSKSDARFFFNGILDF